MAGLFAGLLAPGLQAAPTAATGLFQWRPFLAPFHSVLLHFPIGFITIAFVLELYRWRRPGRELDRVMTLVLALSTVAAAAAAGLGLMRAGHAEYDARTLSLHQWTGLTVVALAGASLLLQGLGAGTAGRPVLTGAFRLLLLASVGLMTVAGHFGGNLTHGSRYLVQNAPAFVRSFVDPEAPATTAPSDPSAMDPRERFFRERIQPVLSAKCLECHGPEKQKGKYRMDTREAALAGGTSGTKAIVPGAPLESQLVRRILLPPQDDAVMPPEGKSTLTAQETVDLLRWITDGATFTAPATPATASPSR